MSSLMRYIGAAPVFSKAGARNKSSGDQYTATVKIKAGEEEQVARMMEFLGLVSACCSMGTSRSLTLDVDGDGAASVTVHRDGEQIKPSDELLEKLDYGGDIRMGLGD